MALALVEPEAAIIRASPLLDHEDDSLRRGASEVIARAHGLRGPLFECGAEEYKQGAAPLKLMIDLGSATFQLETNGISSLFCNFHNQEWRGFARAFREIGATRSAKIIEEFSRYQLSPGVLTEWVPGLEESSEEAEERLKQVWYADEDRRDKRMLEYVLGHREHFQLPQDDCK